MAFLFVVVLMIYSNSQVDNRSVHLVLIAADLDSIIESATQITVQPNPDDRLFFSFGCLNKKFTMSQSPFKLFHFH